MKETYVVYFQDWDSFLISYVGDCLETAKEAGEIGKQEVENGGVSIIEIWANGKKIGQMKNFGDGFSQ